MILGFQAVPEPVPRGSDTDPTRVSFGVPGRSSLKRRPLGLLKAQDGSQGPPRGPQEVPKRGPKRVPRGLQERTPNEEGSRTPLGPLLDPSGTPPRPPRRVPRGAQEGCKIGRLTKRAPGSGEPTEGPSQGIIVPFGRSARRAPAKREESHVRQDSSA